MHYKPVLKCRLRAKKLAKTLRAYRKNTKIGTENEFSLLEVFQYDIGIIQTICPSFVGPHKHLAQK